MNKHPELAKSGAPIYQASAEEFCLGINCLDFLDETELFSSRAEIKRGIKTGAIKINNKAIAADRDIWAMDLQGTPPRVIIGTKRDRAAIFIKFKGDTK